MAMAIMGLAVEGIINGYNFCTNSSQKAALHLAGNARAMERIEEIRSAKWDTASVPMVDQLVATNFPSKSVTLDISGTGGVIRPATVDPKLCQGHARPVGHRPTGSEHRGRPALVPRLI